MPKGKGKVDALVPAATPGFTNLKLVMVGDGAVGKTSLMVCYVEGRFPKSYVPTIFDNFETVRTVDSKDYLISLWDTAGQEEYAHLRPSSYPGTDLFLICFSLGSERSFLSISKWIEEVRAGVPNADFLLVGNKCDLRTTTKLKKSKEEIAAYAQKIGAVGYVECSAKDMVNIDSPFDLALEHCIATGKGTAREGIEDSYSASTIGRDVKCGCIIQ